MTDLDTSGFVQCPAPDQKPNETTGCWFWSDLSPFAQGYVEALFASADHPGFLDVESGNNDAGHIRVGFSDLAPETLARIIADCGPDPQGYLYPTSARMGYPHTVEGGRKFWSNRQASVWADFPPLTVQLGDDGKVRFA